MSLSVFAGNPMPPLLVIFEKTGALPATALIELYCVDGEVGSAEQTQTTADFDWGLFWHFLAGSTQSRRASPAWIGIIPRLLLTERSD
jgi:hypothetical protein